MENPSGPEKPLPEGAFKPTYVPPPGLELARGTALFAVVLMVFFLVQSLVFIGGVIERSPEHAGQGFSSGLLTDPAFRQRMQDLMYNGDMVASQALWSGLAGLVLLLVLTALWKRRHMADFLGLRAGRIGGYLKWGGVFLLLGLAIEGLAHLSPVFRSDFMEQVVGSSTNKLLLVLGVGIMAPLFEEFLLRGLFYGSLRHLADEHVAIAITAGVFTVMHLQYTWPVMLLVLLMGVVLGYARSRGGSIWVAVFLHALNNVGSILLA